MENSGTTSPGVNSNLQATQRNDNEGSNKESQVSKSENIESTSEFCSNCNSPFRNKDDRITIVYIDDLNQNISISAALSFIYEARGLDHNPLSGESVFLKQKTQKSQFPLCLACSCKLRTLYHTFKQFTELRNLESLIAKTLEEILSTEAVEKQLEKTKVAENDNFPLLNIKIEADECLTNFEDLIDSSYDPNSTFADINSDNDNDSCDNDGDEGFPQENSESSDESEANDNVSAYQRPKRNVTRKKYSETDYGLESPEEESEKCPSGASESEDEDFKPEKHIITKGKSLKLTIKKEMSPVKRGRGRPRKYPLKIKEEPEEVPEEEEDDEGVPWCMHCSKAFKSMESLKRHSRIHVKENDDSSLMCSICSQSFQSEELLHIHMNLVHIDKDNNDCQPGSSGAKKRLVLTPKILPLKQQKDGTFLCPYCARPFCSEKNLRRHVRIHIDEYDSLLKCKICNKKFSRREHLNRHVTCVHEKKGKMGMSPEEKTSKGSDTTPKPKSLKMKDVVNENYKDDNYAETKEGDNVCPHCNKIFKSSDSLRRHVRIHTDQDNSRLICKICSRKFTREHHLKRHSAAVHNKKIVLESRVKAKPIRNIFRPKEDSQKCPVCSENIEGRRSEFKDHVASHGVENPWVCSHCSKSYGALHRLRQHMARVHQEGRAVYSCQICDITFGLKHILSQHQIDIHTVPNNVDVESLELLTATMLSNSLEKTSFRCTICSKYAPHICDICGKKFLLERSLKIHMLLHNNQSPHVCEVCNRSFARADHLKRHLEVKHRDGKLIRHVCEVCGKEYNQRHKLKMHMISHTDEKPFACELCDKKFNHPSSLLAHKTTHVEERKFCCSTCGRTFKRWCHLRDHEALHAENIPRPFACTVPGCLKTFKRNKDLKNHANVHTGVKDNICETCGAAFNRIDNLRAHVRAIHLNDESVRRRPNKKKNNHSEGNTRETVVRRPRKRTNNDNDEYKEEDQPHQPGVVPFIPYYPHPQYAHHFNLMPPH